MSDDEDGDTGGFYEGERLKGQRHGFGAFYFPNGARYIGTWNKGLKHGVGKFIYPDGGSYEGDWWQNKRHGSGRYVYPNGDIYDGMWTLDKRNGFGRYCGAKSNTYHQGYFKYGLLHGPVTVISHNVLFECPFEDGKPCGKGTYRLPNGLEIHGAFRLQGAKKVPLWMTKRIRHTFASEPKKLD